MWSTIIPGKIRCKRSRRMQEWSMWMCFIGSSAILNFLWDHSVKVRCITVSGVIHRQSLLFSSVNLVCPFTCVIYEQKETQKPQKTPPGHGNEVVGLVMWLGYERAAGQTQQLIHRTELMSDISGRSLKNCVKQHIKNSPNKPELHLWMFDWRV